MLWYNKGVYCKEQFSAGDSSLKSQFWTGESKLLKSKDCHKFCFLAQGAKCASILLILHHGAGHVWTLNLLFRVNGAAGRAPFPEEQVRAQPTCLLMFSGGFLDAPGHETTAHGMKSLWMRIHGAVLNSTIFHLNMNSLCKFSGVAFWHFYFNDVRAACYCQAHN